MEIWPFSFTSACFEMGLRACAWWLSRLRACEAPLPPFHSLSPSLPLPSPFPSSLSSTLFSPPSTHPARPNTNTAPVPRTLPTRDTKRYVPAHHPFSVYDWLQHYPVHQTAEVGLGEGREGDGVCVSRCFGRRGGAAVGGSTCVARWRGLSPVTRSSYCGVRTSLLRYCIQRVLSVQQYTVQSGNWAN